MVYCGLLRVLQTLKGADRLRVGSLGVTTPLKQQRVHSLYELCLVATFILSFKLPMVYLNGS